jgi:hypothetical protein
MELNNPHYTGRDVTEDSRYVVASPTHALVMHWFDETLTQGDISRARQLLEFMDPADHVRAVKRLSQLSTRTKPRDLQTPAVIPTPRLAPSL